MFFYGTLKRGERNHDVYCDGAVEVCEASVRGELYGHPAGYPAMVVPEETVRATGTADHARDAAQGHQHPLEGTAEISGDLVFGELFVFDDPEEHLPALDLLEGFVPGDPTNEYRRVLIPACTPDRSAWLAWAYVVDAAPGEHLPAGRWPA